MAAERGGRTSWLLFWPCWVIGLTLATAPQAHASLIGYYDPGNWTLTNINLFAGAGTDGSYLVNQDGSLVLFGGNSGSGFPGQTDFFIAAPTPGFVNFSWSYFSPDTLLPPDDHSGYLLGSTFPTLSFTLLSDKARGASGTISLPVTGGELFGFSVRTDSNTGGNGVLTISGFAAPTAAPEPGSGQLLVFGISVVVGVSARRRHLRPHAR